MANSVFANAISGLKNAEEEVKRQELHHADVQLAIQSVQAKLDVLKKNEAELEAKIAIMANEVDVARKTVAEADKNSNKKLADAEAQAVRVVSDAHAKGRKIISDAQDECDKLKSAAQATNAENESRLRKVRGDLANVEAQLRDATGRHQKLKEAAQAFIAS